MEPKQRKLIVPRARTNNCFSRVLKLGAFSFWLSLEIPKNCCGKPLSLYCDFVTDLQSPDIIFDNNDDNNNGNDNEDNFDVTDLQSPLVFWGTTSWSNLPTIMMRVVFNILSLIDDDDNYNYDDGYNDDNDNTSYDPSHLYILILISIALYYISLYLGGEI